MLPETDIGRDPNAFEPILPFEWGNFDNPAPDAFNWVTKNCVNTPQKQGICGSCYAFAATSAIESSYCIQGNELLKLSE